MGIWDFLTIFDIITTNGSDPKKYGVTLSCTLRTTEMGSGKIEKVGHSCKQEYVPVWGCA